jgi:hypothetical protein
MKPNIGAAMADYSSSTSIIMAVGVFIALGLPFTVPDRLNSIPLPSPMISISTKVLVP